MIFSGISIKCLKIPFRFPDKRILLYVFWVALFGAIGTLFYNLGISKESANVSVVAALTFSSPLVAILYGKFVYKEKLSIQQWFALLFILTGVVAVSLLS